MLLQILVDNSAPLLESYVSDEANLELKNIEGQECINVMLKVFLNKEQVFTLCAVRKA